MIAGIAEEYPGVTMEDAVSGHVLCTGAKFTTILQFMSGILCCLDAILVKKENVTAFLSLGGVAALTELLTVAHKPRRFVLASFSSVMESPPSLGHYPVVKVCGTNNIILSIPPLLSLHRNDVLWHGVARLSLSASDS